MHASVKNRHVCGAERIVSEERIDDMVRELITRAMQRGARPDQAIVAIDSIDTASIEQLTSLDLVTLTASDALSSRATATRILLSTGVSITAIQTAFCQLSKGAAPSGANMRGAMILDAVTGERLEPDQERGIRASRFDWADEALEQVTRLLADIGLMHYRTREALALATKVAYAPGMVAELCWSDEPDYTAGYIAARSLGYIRFPFFKQSGDAHGGRAFFVSHAQVDLLALIRYLEKANIMIDNVGLCSAAMEPELFFNREMNRHV